MAVRSYLSSSVCRGLWSAKIRSSSDEMVFVMEAAEDGASLHGIGLSAAMS